MGWRGRGKADAGWAGCALNRRVGVEARARGRVTKRTTTSMGFTCMTGEGTMEHDEMGWRGHGLERAWAHMHDFTTMIPPTGKPAT